MVNAHVATFAAEARSFGEFGEYFDVSRPAAPAVLGRLPQRYGHERVDVHTAELAGMLAAFRWRRIGEWNLFVGDRSALFAVIRRALEQRGGDITSSPCAPLESRLRVVIREICEGFAPACSRPSWLLNQGEEPARWNVWRQEDGEESRKCWCQVAVRRPGLVGVDVKSHQSGAGRPIPCEAVVWE